MSGLELTRHGVKRIRQRVGIPKKACEAWAQRAWASGKKVDPAEGNNSREARWARSVWWRSGALPGTQFRIYSGFLLVVRNGALVTVYSAPGRTQ